MNPNNEYTIEFFGLKLQWGFRNVLVSFLSPTDLSPREVHDTNLVELDKLDIDISDYNYDQTSDYSPRDGGKFGNGGKDLLFGARSDLVHVCC